MALQYFVRELTAERQRATTAYDGANGAYVTAFYDHKNQFIGRLKAGVDPLVLTRHANRALKDCHVASKDFYDLIWALCRQGEGWAASVTWRPSRCDNALEGLVERLSRQLRP
jgi:hypothetical protein